MRIIFNKNKFAHPREIFEEQKDLNIYPLNILSNIISMHRVENKTAPSIFLTKFCKSSHVIPINLSAHNLLVPTLKLNKSKYRVSIKSPLLWNSILTKAEKTQESLPKFRTTIKEKLLLMTNKKKIFTDYCPTKICLERTQNTVVLFILICKIHLYQIK